MQGENKKVNLDKFCVCLNNKAFKNNKERNVNNSHFMCISMSILNH